MNRVGRGLTRIWVVFIGLIELGIAIACSISISGWLNGDPYGSFHDVYSVRGVISPFAIGMLSVAAVAYALWLVAVWVARGFSD